MYTSYLAWSSRACPDCSSRRGNTFRIVWPAAATQFKLQATTTLPANWTDVTTPIVVEGNDNVVTESIGTTGNKFYRLIGTP